MYIPDFPEDNKPITYEEALLDILLSKRNVELLKASMNTYSMCKTAVDIQPNLIQYIPDEFKTYELCESAVLKWTFALEWVPMEHRTYELCKKAVLQNSQALYWVPEYNKSYELCCLALKKNPDVISWVPNQMKCHELYLNVIGDWVYFNGPAMLYSVPENYRTIEMYIVAIRGNRHCKDFVPLELRDEVLKYF
jgi:hypothetical protein